MQKTVLITGGSRGIGLECVKIFLDNGFQVINVSRKEAQIEGVINICGDITDKIFLEELLYRIKEHTQRLDVLLNNAGVGMYGTWEETKIDDLRRLFELNFFAHIAMTQTLFPMLKASRGTIMNLSSVAGKIYTPYMGGYSASKFALSAFSDTLRTETKKYGMHVCDLVVGRIGTGFSERAYGKKSTPKTPFVDTPERLAKKIFEAYERGKKSIVFPRWYKIFIVFAKIAPNIYDNVTLKKWEGVIEGSQ